MPGAVARRLLPILIHCMINGSEEFFVRPGATPAPGHGNDRQCRAAGRRPAKCASFSHEVISTGWYFF